MERIVFWTLVISIILVTLIVCSFRCSARSACDRLSPRVCRRWPFRWKRRTPDGQFNGTLCGNSVISRVDSMFGVDFVWYQSRNDRWSEILKHACHVGQNPRLVCSPHADQTIMPRGWLGSRNGPADPRVLMDRWLVYHDMMTKRMFICDFQNEHERSTGGCSLRLSATESSGSCEKNWSPFLLNSTDKWPHFSHTLNPHRVLRVTCAIESMVLEVEDIHPKKMKLLRRIPHRWLATLFGKSPCEKTDSIHLLRGGTPALRIPNDPEERFIAFGHTPQYTAFAYTFSSVAPYEITHISRPFQFEERCRVLFPTGLQFTEDGSHVRVSCGINDRFTGVYEIPWTHVENELERIPYTSRLEEAVLEMR
jgi:hypothetical protein